MAYTPESWTRIIGLDLSKQTFKGCILSGEGFVKRRHFEGKMTRDAEGYEALAKQLGPNDLVIMEAGSSTFSLARYLTTHTQAEVTVLNPGDLRLIWGSQKKTDKADAMKLACIGRDNRKESWPIVTVPSEQEQIERSIITNYVTFKEDETRKFNKFFAIFNGQGYPDIDKARCKENIAYRYELVESLLGFNELAMTLGNMYNQMIDLIQLQLEAMEKKLVEICLAHPKEAVSWLSMPGIGLINAATLIAYAGDCSRFSRADQLLNYAGMVPKLKDSGEAIHHGKITKRGNYCIRRNICQGGQIVMRMNPNCPLTRFAYKRKKELIFNGKVAVAVASKMLKIGFALVRNNDIYIAAKEDKCEKLKAKLTGYKLKALIPYLPQ